MKFLIEHGQVETIKTDALVLGLFEDDSDFSPISKLNPKLRSKIKELFKLKDFSGEKGQTFIFHYDNSIKRVLLIGLGKKKEFDMETFRETASNIARYFKGKNYEKYTFYLPKYENFDADKLVRVFVEISEITLYTFDKFKSKKKEVEKKKKLETYSLFVADHTKQLDSSADDGIIVAEGNILVRKLANMPSNELTPSEFSKIAASLAKENKLKITVLDKKQIIKKGLNLIHAVSKGSKEEPKLVILEYKGSSLKDSIAIVGKGVTFDTGGINLKPSTGINTMKYDMAGAATVLASIVCASKLKLKTNIIAYCPMVENMPSGEAYKPDDVFTAYNKKTVEIGNTDAEGRLILADALSYAVEFKPKKVIDIATLTGAALVATGNEYCPIIGNNQELINDLRLAASKSGEKVWQLPLAKEYDELLKSEIADIKNVSDIPGPGTILGALFLKNFVNDIPWVHIDIAGVGWSKIDRKYYSIGPTGFGVRLLTQYLCDECSK